MEANNAGDANIRPGAGEENLENQDLSFLQAIAVAFFSQYGWFLLVLCVGVYFLIQYLSKMRPSLFQSSAPAVSQDPSSVVKREEALEASRRRMQAELDAKAAEFKEKQQRLEEEKRQQKIEMWESVKEGKSFKRNACGARPFFNPTPQKKNNREREKKWGEEKGEDAEEEEAAASLRSAQHLSRSSQWPAKAGRMGMLLAAWTP
ncbi:selenoprotein S [Silurus meridionalis]|uniref:selenoprotein S n=1 Tax=Silurus meridionalis TaxID=175797 RepID=UPI001EEBDE74|nr:selenoprotein S [Silurus meridionalis]